MDSPERFVIRVEQEVLFDLKARLARTRWTQCIENSGWEYGTNEKSLQNLIRYWQESFDWQKQQDWINSFPQFTIPIDGLRIHFVHLRSDHPSAIPLILTHGWPTSFIELLNLARLLQDSFHVVVPSIPGYGFSEASKKPGMAPRKIAAMWVQLMSALGYKKFIAQGGDWGATISSWIGLDFPESLIGIHLNYIPGSYQPANTQDLTDAEVEFSRSKNEWLEKEGAYGHIQGTKPQTLAFAVEDSPAGLASWLLEKAHGWSYCDGDVLEYFTPDVLLTNIMVYWMTKTFGSSIRLYYEARKSPFHLHPGQRVSVPCAIARFAKEEPMPPREWVERGYNVVRWTEFPVGSHYAPMEVPELLAQDIKASFLP